MSIRALIVDDEPYARERLRELCAQEPDIAVVGEASHGVEAIEQAHATHPNLLLSMCRCAARTASTCWTV